MKTKTKIILSVVFLVLFIAFIVVIRTADVAAIGPKETSVGLSSVNKYVHELSGEHPKLYKIAELLGFCALGCCGVFAVFGLWQLITRRSLKKVDLTIYALGGLYAVTLAIYVLFEKIIINYRPMIIEGETDVEASFPSSHTVLAIVVMGSAILLVRYYILNITVRRVVQAACAVVLVSTVFARLWSGAHWLTDIIGGILISAALLFMWSGLFDLTAKKDGLVSGHRHDI